MSDKRCVMIGAGGWYSKPGTRIGIYNTNYVAGFEKTYDREKPWFVTSRGSIDLNTESFATHEEATTFVREFLTEALK